MMSRAVFVAALMLLSGCSDNQNDNNAPSIDSKIAPENKPSDEMDATIEPNASDDTIGRKQALPKIPLEAQDNMLEAEVKKLLDELDKSLEGYDDAAIMNAYGPEGSAEKIAQPRNVNINYKLATVALEFHSFDIDRRYKSTNLLLDASELESNVKLLAKDAQNISGVTGITSDPSGFGFSVDLSGDYLFAFDEHELNDKAKASLEKIWGLYDKYGGESMEVQGHTDSKGSLNYNLELSKKRANSVKRWFIERGFEEEKINSVGLGETQPVAPNTSSDGGDNPEGRALNRRVSIAILTSKAIAQ